MRWVELVHRWTGGLIGALLAVMGLSGAILIHRRLWVMLPHAGDAPRQGTAELSNAVARLMADPAHRPELLTFADRDLGLDRLVYKGGAGAYADQAGAIVSDWSSQWQRPELWLFDLHHHLFAGDTGEAIIGVAALAGIGFVVTGTLLWWRTRKTFAFRLWPKRMSRSAIVRHHRDLGIVAAPLLLLSLVTGSLLVFRPLAVVFGPSAPAQIARALKPPPALKGVKPGMLDWPAMIRAARARFPQAELRSIAMARRGNGLIVFRMRQPEEWLPGGRTGIWFAADDGRVMGSRDARDFPAAVRAYNLVFPLHAAKVGGLAYRLVMTLSGLTLALLGSLAVWTFWFRRRIERPALKSARNRVRTARLAGKHRRISVPVLCTDPGLEMNQPGQPERDRQRQRGIDEPDIGFGR